VTSSHADDCDCFYCQYDVMPPQIDYYEKKPKKPKGDNK
jgi:hypothetical protein